MQRQTAMALMHSSIAILLIYQHNGILHRSDCRWVSASVLCFICLSAALLKTLLSSAHATSSFQHVDLSHPRFDPKMPNTSNASRGDLSGRPQ